jgi:hypothetical protein
MFWYSRPKDGGHESGAPRCHLPLGERQPLTPKALSEGLRVFRLEEAEHDKFAIIAAHEVSQRLRRQRKNITSLFTGACIFST